MQRLAKFTADKPSDTQLFQNTRKGQIPSIGVTVSVTGAAGAASVIIWSFGTAFLAPSSRAAWACAWAWVLAWVLAWKAWGDYRFLSSLTSLTWVLLGHSHQPQLIYGPRLLLSWQ